MVIFSVFVSIVFATLMRETPAEQVRFALRLVAGFIAAGIAIGWLLYPLPI
jgi:hypothetical protein